VDIVFQFVLIMEHFSYTLIRNPNGSNLVLWLLSELENFVDGNGMFL